VPVHETFMFVSTIRFASGKEQIRIALELRGAQAAITSLNMKSCLFVRITNNTLPISKRYLGDIIVNNSNT
jgi:hypothetical protein